MQANHELKCWPPYFLHLLDERKRFEVRYDDRRFRVGDIIKFREYVPKEHGYAEDYYTGRNLFRRVRYILNPRPERDPDCGLVAGYVVLDLEPVDNVARNPEPVENETNERLEPTAA
jgi:Domain of unknown function (DUF3850)